MNYDFIPLDFRRLEPEEQRSCAVEFYELMSRRRSALTGIKSFLRSRLT